MGKLRGTTALGLEAEQEMTSAVGHDTQGLAASVSLEARFQFLEETIGQSQNSYAFVLNPVREWDDFDAWFQATSPENIMELVPGPDGKPIEVSEKAMDSARFAFYDGRPIGEALARGGFEPSANDLQAVITEIDREQQAIFKSRYGENAQPSHGYSLETPDQLVIPPTVLELDNGNYVEVSADVMDKAQQAFYQDPERDDFRAAVGLNRSDDEAEAIFEHLMHQRIQMQGAVRDNDLASFFDESTDAAVVWSVERGMSPIYPVDHTLSLEHSPTPVPVFDEFEDQQVWASIERGLEVDIARPGPEISVSSKYAPDEQLVLPEWWDLDEPRTEEHEVQHLADPPASLPLSPQHVPEYPNPEEPTWYRDGFDSPSFDLDL